MDDVFIAEYRIKKFGAGLDLGTDFGRDAELRLGYDIADYTGRRRVGSPDLPDVDGTEKYAHLDFAMDTQTSPLVPTRGFRLRSTLRQYFSAPTASGPLDGVTVDSPQSFTTGEVRTSWFRRVRDRGDRVFAIAEGGSFIRRGSARQRLLARWSAAARFVQQRSAARRQLHVVRRRVPARGRPDAGRSGRQHLPRRLGRSRVGRSTTGTIRTGRATLPGGRSSRHCSARYSSAAASGSRAAAASIFRWGRSSSEGRSFRLKAEATGTLVRRYARFGRTLVSSVVRVVRSGGFRLQAEVREASCVRETSLLDARVGPGLRRMAAPLRRIGHVGLVESPTDGQPSSLSARIRSARRIWMARETPAPPPAPSP